MKGCSKRLCPKTEEMLECNGPTLTFVDTDQLLFRGDSKNKEVAELDAADFDEDEGIDADDKAGNYEYFNTYVFQGLKQRYRLTAKKGGVSWGVSPVKARRGGKVCQKRGYMLIKLKPRRSRKSKAPPKVS